MRHFLLVTLVFFFQSTSAQTDTGKIYTCTHLKKGFYKTYEEFVDNKPSCNVDFIIVSTQKSNNDSTIISAEYILKDPTHPVDNIWGFCDGNSVFVKHTHSIFNKKYYRLECVGKYCYFNYWYNGTIPVPLITSTAVMIPVGIFGKGELRQMIIDDKGKFKNPSLSLLKKLLSVQPLLLQSFKNESAKFEQFETYDEDTFQTEKSYEEEVNLMKDYLIKLNDACRNNKN